MKDYRNFLLFAVMMLMTVFCFSSEKNLKNKPGVEKPLADYVDTKIGVIGTRASNCVLGPQMPFGCINPSPQSPKGTTSGYNPKMPTRGFGQLQVSGTGGASRYGHFLISPQIGIRVSKNSHDSPAVNEETKAYYYKTKLQRYNLTPKFLLLATAPSTGLPFLRRTALPSSLMLPKVFRKTSSWL